MGLGLGPSSLFKVKLIGISKIMIKNFLTTGKDG